MINYFNTSRLYNHIKDLFSLRKTINLLPVKFQISVKDVAIINDVSSFIENNCILMNNAPVFIIKETIFTIRNGMKSAFDTDCDSKVHLLFQ